MSKTEKAITISRMREPAPIPATGPSKTTTVPTGDLISDMEHAEIAAQTVLTLHEILVARGEDTLARLAWITFLETSTTAEHLGNMLGMEVSID